MQSWIFPFLPAIGRAIPASTVLSLFFVPSHYPESSISAVQEWSAAVNSLQKQQKQREPFEERAGEAPWTAVSSDPDLNLGARFCCRLAAGAAIGDSRYNHLLRRRKPEALTGWPLIAAAVMLVRYRNRRRAAA